MFVQSEAEKRAITLGNMFRLTELRQPFLIRQASTPPPTGASYDGI